MAPHGWQGVPLRCYLYTVLSAEEREPLTLPEERCRALFSKPILVLNGGAPDRDMAVGSSDCEICLSDAALALPPPIPPHPMRGAAMLCSEWHRQQMSWR